MSALVLCGQLGVSGPCLTAACLREVETFSPLSVTPSHRLIRCFDTSLVEAAAVVVLIWTQPTLSDDIPAVYIRDIPIDANILYFLFSFKHC